MNKSKMNAFLFVKKIKFILKENAFVQRDTIQLKEFVDNALSIVIIIQEINLAFVLLDFS